MPCCPPNDAGIPHCVAAQCIVELPQKAEAPIFLAAQAAGEYLPVATLRFPSLAPALAQNAVWQPPVFRLKDDLRI
jgi:hypothetical protein